MNTTKIKEIQEDLIKKLKPSRYEHTMAVAYTAAALAMRYGEDMDKAFMAGLLHDCAKYLTDVELIKECQDNNVELTKHELEHTALIHSKVGVLYAKNVYGVDDPDILKAIRSHTTGNTDMTLLDKIIYIADYIEPNRDRAPHLEELRKLAFEDIDECLVATAKGTIEYVIACCGTVDDETLKVYESMKADLAKKTNN